MYANMVKSLKELLSQRSAESLARIEKLAEKLLLESKNIKTEKKQKKKGKIQ